MPQSNAYYLQQSKISIKLGMTNANEYIVSLVTK